MADFFFFIKWRKFPFWQGGVESWVDIEKTQHILV